MKNKAILLLLASILISTAVEAQRVMEKLNRGLVAVRASDNTAFLSWRLLSSDDKSVSFNVYRKTDSGSEVKLNKEPIAKVTNFTDKSADFKKDNIYTVKTILNGKETSDKGKFTLKSSNAPSQYISIPLNTPDRYSPGDCSAADLDGDGEYEIIVHMNGIGRDNGSGGLTTAPIFQAYKLDGTMLWEINLGTNIREGAHYTQFMVYDFDGDGKAEMICKTADGSKDGLGNIIGDANADWRTKTSNGIMDPWAGRQSIPRPPVDQQGPRPTTNTMQQRPRGDNNPLAGRILDGPEYLTVFEGKTGKALATTNYIPDRGAEGLWGDKNANRSERYLAGVAYLDGKLPSAIMCRGYYTRATLVAWDWRNGKLTKRWMFDSYDGTPGNEKYSGQGNHSLSIADVDQDGFDEIVYGACSIDHDGKGLYSTGFGHGDAMHCSDLDPERPGLEVFQVHEDVRAASKVAAGHFRDAKTGELIWGLPATFDVGRGMCADIDPRYAGYECWSVASGGLYSAKGVKISEKQPRSCNFAIWWDGDLIRELLDKNYITKWDFETSKDVEIFRADSCTSINGTKATPNLSADLFGDWREEVVLSNVNRKELRIFTTTIPTDYKLVTLMHDPQYRLAIAWQNVAYNQPPHPGFYLGSGGRVGR